MPHRGDAAAAAVTAAGNRKAWSSIEGQDGGHAAVSAADNNRLGEYPGTGPQRRREGSGSRRRGGGRSSSRQRQEGEGQPAAVARKKQAQQPAAAEEGEEGLPSVAVVAVCSG